MRNDIQNIGDQKIKSKGSRPITLLTVIMVLTWVTLIWFGWNTWSSYHKTKTEKEYHSKTEKLSGIIIHLDEVLTMSACMAAAKGDLQWEKRYRSFEPKLDAAIKEAMRYAPEAYYGKAASDTDAANIRLVEMENQAFDLIRQGRIEEAKTLLFSDEYENQKRIYTQGMTKFADGLSVYASTNLQDEQWQAFLRVGIVLVLIPLLIIVWFVAFQVVRSWEKTLISKKKMEKEIAERKKAEEALLDSETRIKELFKNINSGVAVYEATENGADFVFKDFNRAAEKIEGIKKEELIGKSVLEMFPEVREFGLFDVFQKVWK